jgi:hypothetical protein
VRIFATGPLNTQSHEERMHSNEWGINESNLAPTANAICGVKTEHSRLEPIEIYEQSVSSYWPL